MGFRQILRNVYDSTVGALRVVVDDISIGTSEGSDPGNADVTTSSSFIVAANSNRKQLIVTNNSDAIIYLATGKDAVLNTGIRLNPAGGASWEPFPAAFMTQPTDPNDMSSCQKMYENHLKHALSVIGIGDLVAGRAGSRLSHVYSGSSQGSDGTAKAPMFTRILHVYPGARSNASDE